MARQIALTTTDNPFNPITNFDMWNWFDTKFLHYDTCQYLAAIANTVEEAMDEIVKENLVGILSGGKASYKKVVA